MSRWKMTRKRMMCRTTTLRPSRRTAGTRLAPSAPPSPSGPPGRPKRLPPRWRSRRRSPSVARARNPAGPRCPRPRRPPPNPAGPHARTAPRRSSRRPRSTSTRSPPTPGPLSAVSVGTAVRRRLDRRTSGSAMCRRSTSGSASIGAISARACRCPIRSGGSRRHHPLATRNRSGARTAVVRSPRRGTDTMISTARISSPSMCAACTALPARRRGRKKKPLTRRSR